MLKDYFKNKKIAIVGLGYVGLPLAIAFARKYNVIGFDIDKQRVAALLSCRDATYEANIDELKDALKGSGNGLLSISSDLKKIKECAVYILTVPTPIDKKKRPNLSPLKNATKMIGKILKKGDIVIFESTVYPGCTEEECVPILARNSNLVYNKDFFCGYSPERINPGDKINTLTKIRKITSGSTPNIAKIIDKLYRSIIIAGTYLAPSIKVAEAAKAIENAQRDLNISFVNELALIFDRVGIDTTDVLDAAATKWNFLNFKPGLVGGHCIGVDPYYLVYKSKKLGYNPKVISSGRTVNDNMGSFIANKIIELLKSNNRLEKKSRALILGFSFKENCPDTRNTKVADIFYALTKSGILVDVYDPWPDKASVQKEFNITLNNELTFFAYDVVLLAVAHDHFLKMDFEPFKKQGAIIVDTKAIIERKLVDFRL